MKIEKLGDLLRSRRLELRIDQRTLAEMTGVATHTISNIERGQGNPTLKVMIRLLDVLGLEISLGPRKEIGEP